MVRVLGREHDLVLLVFDRGGAAFEIEASREFFARLVEGVVDLLFVDFGNNVEGRHGRIADFLIADCGTKGRRSGYLP